MIKKIILVTLLISAVIGGFLVSHFLYETYYGNKDVKSSYGEVTCVNEDGQLVDWYLVYKLPRAKGASVSGSEYLYMDSINPRWRLGKYRVESPNSIFGRTLNPIYGSYKSNKANVGYVLYNDGVPGSREYSSAFGHIKGVIAWTLYGGFHITHSVPRFPPFPKEGYNYPSTGTRYGQTALCMSLSYNTVVELDAIIPVNNPRVYSCFIPSVDVTTMSNFKAICVDKIVSIGTNVSTYISSEKGEEFLIFAKSADYNQDILSAWIAPTFQTDLLAETWLHGTKLPTNCTGSFHVYNVAAVSISTFDFVNYDDHSKWAVSLHNADTGWVCVGDINREPAQLRRGGGYTCTRNTDIYNSLRDAVTVFESCEIGQCSSIIDDEDLVNTTCKIALNSNFVGFC
ncbi:SWPV1-041 [Shearwaterpox virus]|uniref:SWPV1-041 n=1 Tax=Shearwaterpox virus TaxID=1974596 RepID=A0A1V0S7Q5_CNPV|nr:SWPV1-041 [Shearwaterpox virus]